jgi:hypothetical protein
MQRKVHAFIKKSALWYKTGPYSSLLIIKRNISSWSIRSLDASEALERLSPNYFDSKDIIKQIKLKYKNFRYPVF